MTNDQLRGEMIDFMKKNGVETLLRVVENALDVVQDPHAGHGGEVGHDAYRVHTELGILIDTFF